MRMTEARERMRTFDAPYVRIGWHVLRECPDEYEVIRHVPYAMYETAYAWTLVVRMPNGQRVLYKGKPNHA